jgi:hypothetical protein
MVATSNGVAKRSSARSDWRQTLMPSRRPTIPDADICRAHATVRHAPLAATRRWRADGRLSAHCGGRGA